MHKIFKIFYFFKIEKNMVKDISRRRFLRDLSLSAGFVGISSLLPSCSALIYKEYNFGTKSLKNNFNPVRFGFMNIANCRGDYYDTFRPVSRDEVWYYIGKVTEFAKDNKIEVFCMNEVDFKSLRTCWIDQSKVIAKKLQYRYVVKDVYCNIPGFINTGNCIISKYPLKINDRRHFGKSIFRAKHIFKTYLDVTLDKKLDILLTHFYDGVEKVRVKEAKMLRKAIMKKAKQNKKLVICGDFNDEKGSKTIEHILEPDYVVAPEGWDKDLTYRSSELVTNIDHLFHSNNIKVENYTIDKRIISDHLGLYADVFIK